MKTHYLFFLLLLSLLPWPLLSSSNIKFQHPVPITNFSDSSSPFNKKEDGGWLKRLSKTSPSPFAERKEKISDMSSPSKDEASENLGGSFLYDGSDDLSNTGISPTRRSLLSLPPKDVVAGLAHLHELGIIHRDLKPQNVLITCEKSLCAKLSDMGISKRLNEGMSSLGHHATGYGSSGWQAPEQILHGRQTRAVDLFSLGCVLFFCITKGKHPFGERLERDSNIVKNRFDLFLVEHIPEAVDLFSQLLHPKPEKRPKAKEVLHHPFFWNSMVRLWFLREVSDKVELKDKVGESDLLKALENTAPVALGGNWDEKMEASFITNFGRQRRYKYNSIRDLLRLIRNKLNHYGELPKEIQELLGSVPEGFYNYFASRFPKLFIEVYKVIYNHCRKEDNFRIYFTSNNLHKTVGGQLQDLCSELQHG